MVKLHEAGSQQAEIAFGLRASGLKEGVGVHTLQDRGSVKCSTKGK